MGGKGKMSCLFLMKPEKKKKHAKLKFRVTKSWWQLKVMKLCDASSSDNRNKSGCDSSTGL